jgi:starvation-inducible outer membrane lipoprotein
MRRHTAVLLAFAFLSACSSLPFGGQSKDERKASCDRIAAQAIQTSSVEEAKNLSAQASECYAALQGG